MADKGLYQFSLSTPEFQMTWTARWSPMASRCHGMFWTNLLNPEYPKFLLDSSSQENSRNYLGSPQFPKFENILLTDSMPFVMERNLIQLCKVEAVEKECYQKSVNTFQLLVEMDIVQGQPSVIISSTTVSILS